MDSGFDYEEYRKSWVGKQRFSLYKGNYYFENERGCVEIGVEGEEELTGMSLKASQIDWVKIEEEDNEV